MMDSEGMREQIAHFKLNTAAPMQKMHRFHADAKLD